MSGNTPWVVYLIFFQQNLQILEVLVLLNRGHLLVYTGISLFITYDTKKVLATKIWDDTLFNIL